MINRTLGLSRFFESAQNYFLNQRTFLSPIEENLYSIDKINNDSVTVRRISIPSQTTDVITSKLVLKYIDLINSARIIKRRSLGYSVAQETTVVELLPMLDWDNDKDFIVESLEISDIPTFSVTEARNDDISQRVQRWLRARRGQNKLRNNLMHIYDSKCCVTDCDIKEILHACHIEPHNIGGNNQITNALLMRSDIHDLFDSNLIGIHPDTLIVVVSSKISNTTYHSLNGKQLNKRRDNSSPNIETLRKRWNIFQSAELNNR